MIILDLKTYPQYNISIQKSDNIIFLISEKWLKPDFITKEPEFYRKIFNKNGRFNTNLSTMIILSGMHKTVNKKYR